MANPLENPFRTAPGSDPPHLVGRTQELSAAAYAAAMTHLGAPAQPIVITGLRGMGKTALLRRIASEASANKALVIYAEASSREPLSESLRFGMERARDTVASIPDRLKRSLNVVIRSMPKAAYELPHDAGAISLSASDEQRPETSFVQSLAELNAHARKHGHYLAFVIDEIQDSPIKELQQLVRYVHESAGTNEPLFFVGAGLTNARDHLHHVRTYTERWRFFEIGLLSRQETKEAVSIPVRDKGVAIESEALNIIARESGGYPFFVQEYASAAWMIHTGRAITAAQVAAVVPGVRLTLENGFYDSRFRSLTPRECAYALAMAHLGPGPHTTREIAERLGSTSEQLSSIRNQLVKKDVAFSPAGGLLEFRIPLTDRYVKEHREQLERRAASQSSLIKPVPNQQGKTATKPRDSIERVR